MRRKEVKRAMERKDIITKKINIIITRKVKKVNMVTKMSMAKKEATKNTKNGVTKKDIINNHRPYQHTQQYLEYILCLGIFVPVIIAFVLNGLA